MNKPKDIEIVGYEVHKQQLGKFKIREYYYNKNEGVIKKRTIKKNLTLSDAENQQYLLESKLKHK